MLRFRNKVSMILKKLKVNESNDEICFEKIFRILL